MSKEYIIKRNNKESGPFTFEEIKGKILTLDTQIYTTDLGWKTVNEITELKEFVRVDNKISKPWYKQTVTLFLGLISLISYGAFYRTNKNEIEQKQIQQKQVEIKDSLDRIVKIEQLKLDSVANAKVELGKKLETDLTEITKFKATKIELEESKFSTEREVNNVLSLIKLVYKEKERVNQFQFGRSSSQKDRQIRNLNNEIVNLTAKKYELEEELSKINLKLTNISDEIIYSEKLIRDLRSSIK
jgi:hypothetical protein